MLVAVFGDSTIKYITYTVQNMNNVFHVHEAYSTHC